MPPKATSSRINPGWPTSINTNEFRFTKTILQPVVSVPFSTETSTIWVGIKTKALSGKMNSNEQSYPDCVAKYPCLRGLNVMFVVLQDLSLANLCNINTHKKNHRWILGIQDLDAIIVRLSLISQLNRTYLD